MYKTVCRRSCIGATGAFLLTATLSSAVLFGQNVPKAGKAKTFREPTWLMPPVQGENLRYKTFDSKVAGEKVSYLLFLPPDYDTTQDKRYPVVYWLHGIGGSQEGVPTMASRLTKAINDGKTPPMIVVYVNGMIRSSYVDSADGKIPSRPSRSRNSFPTSMPRFARSPAVTAE